MNAETTGSLIKEMRKEKGWTQKELAELLHVTDKAVSKWETGKSMPDFALVPDLCRILELDVTELLSGKRGGGDMDLKDSVQLIMELVDRQKEEKAKRLNGYFFMGLCLLLFAIFYSCFSDSFHPALFFLCAAVGIGFEAAGFYINSKDGKRRTFTPVEMKVLTENEKDIQMTTAEEMLQFAKKYQKAGFKQYRLAFEEIENCMQEGEYAVFSMVGDSYTVNDNPGPWYAVLAVTNRRVIFAGETIRGRMFTRYVSDRYEREEVLSVRLVNRKLLFDTTLKHPVKLEGEHMEAMLERIKEALGQ